MIAIATLDGIELPCHFKYDPLVPEKRISFQKTAKGVVSQESTTPIINQGPIPFTYVGNGSQASTICNLYTSSAVVPFTGYYGDSYEVKVSKLTISVQGGWYFMEGVLYALCTADPFCPPDSCK